MRICLDPAALVQLDTCADAVRIRPPPDRQQHDISFQLFRRATRCRFDGQDDPIISLARTCHFRADAEFHALTCQYALERLGDLRVHRRDDAIEELNHRHVRTQPTPYAAELESDVAAADYHEMAWHLIQLQPTCR